MRWPYANIGVVTTRTFRNLLNKIHGDIAADMQEHKDRADNIQAQINNLVADGDSSPEAAQARVGTDGTNYTTLKQRLDTENQSVTSQLADFAINLSPLAVESDYTQAFQRALDSMDSNLGGVINIPQGKTINFTTVTITKKNIRVTGGGTLTGKIVINCFDNNSCNVSIDGVRFNTEVAIEVKKGRGFSISKNVFENCDKAIYINPDEDLPFHQISKGKINNNEFLEVNYCLYVDKQDSVTDRFFQVNDFTFLDNIMKANICHIFAKEIDGITISGNTFFFPSWDEASSEKTYNIYVKNADWVIISDNNLFESGYESIYLDYVTHLSISDNNIAWCGQRKPSSAILINYSGTATIQAMIKVSDNNISKATKHGVELIGVAYGSIKGNVIECQLNNYEYYYGTVDLSTVLHYGTYINNKDATASLKLVIENSNLNVEESNRSKYVSVSKLDITDTRTIIDSEGVQQINLVQPSPVVVSDILNGFNGKQIKIFAYTGNTTIRYNPSKFTLQNSIDVTIPPGGSLILEYYAGKWIEISRNFITPAYLYYSSQDITDTRTTIDASQQNNFNLVQPSATLITGINGGVNGKIISFLAFNGNTTIQHVPNYIILKGAVNTNIPYNGYIEFKYFANKWFEINRNF